MSTHEIRIRLQRGEEKPIMDGGAGLAGLGCAIVLARAGRRVLVREWRSEADARIHGSATAYHCVTAAATTSIAIASRADARPSSRPRRLHDRMGYSR